MGIYFFLGGGIFVVFFENTMGVKCCSKREKNFRKKSISKELSLCHKLKFSNDYILATWWCKPLILNLNFFISENFLFEVSKVYDIVLQKCKSQNMSVCDKYKCKFPKNLELFVYIIKYSLIYMYIIVCMYIYICIY